MKKQKSNESNDGNMSVQILKRLNDNMSVRWRPRQFQDTNESQNALLSDSYFSIDQKKVPISNSRADYKAGDGKFFVSESLANND